MFLTREEEKVLDGEKGPVLAKAMKLVTTIGDLNGAKKLVHIKRSQIAGVSYKTSGEPTLQLLESFAEEGVRVRSLSTLNPAGMDLERWKEMRIRPSFAERQLRICSAYASMGIDPLCTCTPYLSGNRPDLGENVGFSESSAIAYVNSVLGARTNRHGGLDALASALIGKVPLMGLLLDENRKGTTLVEVGFEPKTDSDFAAIGYYIGKNLKMDEVPILKGLRGASRDELKLMGAAAAAAGSVALFHVPGITPESPSEHSLQEWQPKARLSLSETELRRVYDELAMEDAPDLVCIGCPHCSVDEVEQVARRLSGRRILKGTSFWVFVSPKVYDESSKRGYLKAIKRAGGDIFRHTCMVVAPIEDMGFRKVASNSAKACFYVPRMTERKCSCGLKSLEECLKLSSEPS